MAHSRPGANGHPPAPSHLNGGYSQPHAPQPLRQAQPQQHTSRAQIFEDEKRRIQASCFSKKDGEGTLVQSYITHIRVEEDGSYPSDPPPPNSDPSHKKPRVIIAAVKTSGRVYLHKARENSDRTFQIGKTWPLEDLTVIESFSSKIQRNPHDDMRVRLAGEIGFALTITKPYFWKAKTAKEKSFFLGSLVKIYHKYTNGNYPTLVGFDPQEERAIRAAVGPTNPQAAQQHQRPPTSPAPPQPPGSNLAPGPLPPMPYAQRPSGSQTSLPSQESGQRRHRPSDAGSSGRSPSATSSGRQRPPSPSRHGDEVPPLQPHQFSSQTPSPAPPGRSTTPRLRSAPSQDSYMRSQSSRDQMLPPRNHTPEPPPKIGHQPSRSNISTPTPVEDRPDNRIPSSRYGSEAPQIPADSLPKSPLLAPSPHDSYSVTNSITSSTAERWKPPGARGPGDRTHAPDESLVSNVSGPSHPSFQSDRSIGSNLNPALPERRRPTLEKNSFASSLEAHDAIEEESMPKPLRSKKSVRDPSPQPVPPEDKPSPLDTRAPRALRTPSPVPTPSPQVQDRSSPKKPAIASDFNSATMENREDSPRVLSRSAISSTPVAPPPATIPRPQTPETQEVKEETSSPETHRPGIGSIMGKRLADKSTANKWKKAAQAATVASAFKPRAGGAGARLLAEKNKPAESGPDGRTGVVPAPGSRAHVPDGINERLAREDRKEAMPEVRISDAAPATELSLSGVQADLPTEHQAIHLVQKAQPKPAYQYDKILKTLDADISLLGGQGQEYESTLSEFGWANSILKSKTVDSMEAEMRREVARLEAGPWLGQEGEAGDHKASGVEDFEKVLDKAIAECDEMDRLLSLYGVELSTLNGDIAYIESQAGGVQVVMANHRSLQEELGRRLGKDTVGYH